MTYNFDIPVTELTGITPEKGRTLASLLTDLIGTETKGPTIQLFGWYNQLLKDGTVDLDEAGRKAFSSLIETTERMFIFHKGQVLAVLDKKTS